MSWIGTVGNLVEFKAPSALRQAPGFTGEIQSTLGGEDYLFTSTAPEARAWDMDLTAADPSDLAALHLLAAGAYGHGPFWLIDSWAAVTNLLSPRRSLPGPGNEWAVSVGTPVMEALPGLGTLPAVSVPGGATLRLANGTPVLGSSAVTASVWVKGVATGTVTAQFLNASGSWTNNAVTTETFGAWTRVSATGTAHPTAVEVDLRITSGSAFTAACPAVTWTPTLRPYIPGQGANRVVLTASSIDTLMATRTHQYAAQSVTFQELRRTNA